MTIQLKKALNFTTGKDYLDIDLSIEPGTLLAISGPSGSGKTTMLRLMAGLEKAELGKLIINGITWLDTQQQINLPPQKRKIGFVFQQYTLFPNMTVLQNLQFAKEKGSSDRVVEELMEIMELNSFSHQLPFQLSGGQQQRVALARALVRKPELLLLDEPLAALDDTLRGRLQDYILKIHQQYQLTTLLVSHEIGEIFKMADRVIILQEGKVQKMGNPTAVFFNETPTSGYQIVGKVLQIQTKNESKEVIVKANDQLFTIPLSTNQATTITVGDNILLSTSTLTMERGINKFYDLK